MAYATPLEARIAKKVTKAITDYDLIERRRSRDGRPVGRQGQLGAAPDSRRAAEARARSRSRSSAVTVDSGYDGYRHDLISKTCEARGWEYRIVHTEIGEAIEDLLDDNATPCSLCARFRRGVLYRLATEVGATKIALGHHLDDFIETLLLNLFFAGALKAMPARLVSDNGQHVVDSAARRRHRSRRRARTRRRRSCRSSAAAARPAAISACSVSASSASSPSSRSSIPRSRAR